MTTGWNPRLKASATRDNQSLVGTWAASAARRQQTNVVVSHAAALPTSLERGMAASPWRSAGSCWPRRRETGSAPDGNGGTTSQLGTWAISRRGRLKAWVYGACAACGYGIKSTCEWSWSSCVSTHALTSPLYNRQHTCPCVHENLLTASDRRARTLYAKKRLWTPKILVLSDFLLF